MTTSLAPAARVAARLPLAAAAPAIGIREAYRIYHPPRSGSARTPADRGLASRELTLVTSRDRVRLAAWVIPGEGPHTVVVCHGMGRDRSSVVEHIAMLHEAGHHVLAFDLRNHGASGSDRGVGGMADRFTSDLRDVLTHVARDRQLGGGAVAVLAFSFSTWPAVHVLRDPAVRVAAVVCDSGPLRDIGAALRHVCDLRRDRLPAALRMAPAYRALRASFEVAGRAMLAVGQWPSDLREVPTSLLFVGGGRDRVVDAGQVEAFARCHPQALYWEAPRATHMNALRSDPEEYSRRITDFLAEAFSVAHGTGETARA